MTQVDILWKIYSVRSSWWNYDQSRQQSRIFRIRRRALLIVHKFYAWLSGLHFITHKKGMCGDLFSLHDALNLSSPANHAKYTPGNQECRTEHTAAHNRLCRSATLQTTTYPFQIAVSSQPLIQFYASTHQFKDNGALTRLVYLEITVCFWCHRGFTVIEG